MNKKLRDFSDKTISRNMNGKELAALVKVTAATVSNWADEGMPCSRAARSGAAVAIDLRRALPWLITRRALKEGPARVGVAQQQAERLRISNRKARGELVEVTLVEEGLKAAVAGLLQDWDALAQRVTSDERLQTAIAAECREAQRRFSEALTKVAEMFAARAEATEA